MKEIGGFFELELNHLKEYHSNAIRLNTGRNCLEYILRANDFKKIYIPFFICEVILEPIKKCHIEYEFYRIDKDFNPIFDYKLLGKGEAFLFVNYFGLKQSTVVELSNCVDNLIIDNTQAFFAEPIKGVHAFYSPRKFVGVADGGYLYTGKVLNTELQRDKSYERMSHLLRRMDEGAQASYNSFKVNSSDLVNNEILQMSNLTHNILCSLDYCRVKKVREENFIYLHEKLSVFNELDISLDELNGPMVYPFMIKDESIRQKLIKNKVFVALYWPNVLDWCNEEDLEYNMSKYILPLPVDQRYNICDLEKIIEILK